MEETDVVVIGAGHNGLVAANFLADAGLQVTVLERHHQIGGMTRSGYAIPEAPEHLINHCAVDPIFWPNSIPAAELDLDVRWVNVDPAFVYLHPTGESIAFWKDPRRTAEDIHRFSHADARAYLELANLFEAICDVLLPMFGSNPVRPDPRLLATAARGALKHHRQLKPIAQFLAASGRDEIAERFEHPVVRSALHVASGCLYPSSYPGSTVQMLIMAFVHRFGCLRPVGGTQAIPDALAKRFRGTILTEAQVADITVRGGRATGVVLTDGREVHARRAVLASCDARQTLSELLPGGAMAPHEERRAAAIPANDLGWGQLKVDVACRGELDLGRFEQDRTDGANLRAASHLMGTEDGLERGYRRAAAGLLPAPDDIGFYNAIPNAVDPTQTPAGQDALYLINITSPAHPEDGWTPKLRAQAIQDTVDRAAVFYGDLLELELGRTAFTNTDMAAEVGAESQAHVAWIINRFGPLRPAKGFAGFSTPVAGLYLGGASCHPGAAVTGTPGYLGAQEVLRDLKRGRVAPVTRPAAAPPPAAPAPAP